MLRQTLFASSYRDKRRMVIVADDPGMILPRTSRIPAIMPLEQKSSLEPSDSKEALEFTKIAFDLSEEYDTPVLLRMCTRFLTHKAL